MLKKLSLLACVAIAALSPAALAGEEGGKGGGNPLFHDRFTADPAPLVVGDTLYLYAGHDEGDEHFRIDEWVAYSTKDMRRWTNHGVIMKPTDFSWAEGEAWASQMVEKDGKFYFYVTVEHDDTHPGKAIGVAVGDSPIGPFKDARGSALVLDNPDTWRAWSDIDPTVMIDDDGTAWMAWGNSNLYLAKLKPNMIELDGEPQELHVTNYLEGPWLHKRGDLYYLTYASIIEGEQENERISYATAPSMQGPWTYRGELTGEAQNSFTIHAGIEQFKGQWYFFYHDGTLTIGDRKGMQYRRSVAAEPLEYDANGLMKPIRQTRAGVTQVPVPTRPAASTIAGEIVSGVPGQTLTSRSATGMVTMILEPERQDRRLSIRIVADNHTPEPQYFGPAMVRVAVDGKEVNLATVEELLGRPRTRGSRDTTLARAASAGSFTGFGSGNTQPDDTVAGMPGQQYATEDAIEESDEARALRETMFHRGTAIPGGSHGGGFLTDRVRRKAKTADFMVTFAGSVHRFEVKL